MIEATLAGAIIGHLVGDFILQNDWMAREKRRSSWVCALHALIWMMCVSVFAGWSSPLVLGVLAIAHFAQDRWGFVRWFMTVNGQSGFARPPQAPWSLIVVDNTLHLVTLWLAWVFIS